MQAETPIAKSVQNFLNNHPINYGPAVFKKENYFKQLEMFHNSSDGLIPEFAHRLAFCYEYGVGVKKDMKKAMSLYKLAKKGKHLGGLTKWSLLRQSDDRSHKSKLKSLEKVIQATNNPIALYLSGKMLTASSSAEDKNKGIRQIVEAAKMEIYAAQFYIKLGNYPGQLDSQAQTLPSPRENKLRRKSVI
jgi:TPR repeat protein